MQEDFDFGYLSSTLQFSAATGAGDNEDVHLNFLPLGGWQQLNAAPTLNAPQWLFASAFTAAGHNSSADSCAGNSADDWAISTASMVHSTSSSGGTCTSAHNLTHSTNLVGCGLDCSDPLIRTAQELVASAVAGLPPGMHAPAGDSAALLNSGTVLLLGQGSTTMYGTNTAQGAVHASTACCLLTPEACHSCQVLSISEHSLQDPAGAVAVYSAQQHLPTVLGMSAAAPGDHKSRRRQGLLVDSNAAGLHHLAAHTDAVAAVAALQGTVSAKLQPESAAEDKQQEQQDQQDLLGLTGSSPATGLQGDSTELGCLEPHSSSTPASEDVLVLGISRSNTAEGGAVQQATDGSVAASTAAESHQALGMGGTAAAPAPTGQPVLQLLSCSSLASHAHAGRSNSSLLPSLSNCSVLRLGSFSTTHGSCSSAEGSFTSQRQGSCEPGQPPVLTAAAVSDPSPGIVPLVQPGLAPVSRPSPLPMLHESRSWGSRLDEAAGPVGRQHRQHGEGLRQASSGQQQEQLIYLLD